MVRHEICIIIWSHSPLRTGSREILVLYQVLSEVLSQRIFGLRPNRRKRYSLHFHEDSWRFFSKKLKIFSRLKHARGILLIEVYLLQRFCSELGTSQWRGFFKEVLNGFCKILCLNRQHLLFYSNGSSMVQTLWSQSLNLLLELLDICNRFEIIDSNKITGWSSNVVRPTRLAFV